MNDPQTSPAQQPDYDFERPHVPHKQADTCSSRQPLPPRSVTRTSRGAGIIRSNTTRSSIAAAISDSARSLRCVRICELSSNRSSIRTVARCNRPRSSTSRSGQIGIRGSEAGVEMGRLLRSIVPMRSAWLPARRRHRQFRPTRGDLLAQYFLFPVGPVRTGLDELPERLQDLENYFKGRQRAAENA